MTTIPADPPATAMKPPNVLKGMLLNLSRVGALAVVVLVFTFWVPGFAFLSASNVENILMQSAVYAIAFSMALRGDWNMSCVSSGIRALMPTSRQPKSRDSCSR